jgi:hypothetical protein
LKDLLYLVIPVIGAMGVGSAALYARAAGFSAGPEPGNVDGITTLAVSLALLGFLFYGMNRFPEKSARLIVAGVTVAGTISGLILLKLSLQASGVSPALFLLTLPLGYLGLNWSVRGYFGSLSQRKATVLMLTSATLLGALIGTSLPAMFAIAFLVILTILDVLVVESGTMPTVVGKASYDQVISVVTLPLEKYVVGLGDFLAYSILSSTALHILGFYGAILSSSLILLGATATFHITKARRRAPGLLLPIGLGLIPIVFGLLRL